MDVMIEHNDYLWDRSGPEDPEIKRLETLLGEFKQQELTSPLARPCRQTDCALAGSPIGGCGDIADRIHGRS